MQEKKPAYMHTLVIHSAFALRLVQKHVSLCEQGLQANLE